MSSAMLSNKRFRAVVPYLHYYISSLNLMLKICELVA